MLAETQSHTEFFIAEFGMVGGKIRWKIALVVTGAAAHSALEQPFPDAMFRTTAHLADLVQQRRHVGCITEPSSQWRIGRLLNGFHASNIT